MLPSSDIGFRDPDGGAPLEAPREWQPCLVEVAMDPADWEVASLSRNGVELALRLERVAGKPTVVAEWPRSGTGSYRVDLIAPEVSETRIIEILPEKIAVDEYRQIIDDLEGELPATIALSLQRLGALAGIEVRAPATVTLEEEVLRLSRAVVGTQGRPGLETLLPAIQRDPHGMLATTEVWVRRRQVRRPLPSTLVRAVSRGWNIDADRRPRQAVDTRVEYTTDVYENKLLKSYSREVDLRLRQIALSIKGPATVVDEVQGYLERLTRAQRLAPFLDPVNELAYHAARPSMVFIRRPDYRAAFEGYLEFHRAVSVRLFDDRLAAPLENLPALYEAWGTLQVLKALVEVATHSGYKIEYERLFVRRAHELFLRLLPNGTPALVLVHPTKGRVSFIPQRAYGPDGDLHSVSYRQIPDVSIEIAPPDQHLRLVIFDPKYKLLGDDQSPAGDEDSEFAPEVGDAGSVRRVSQARPPAPAAQKPKKIDIDTMHAYRDAIRNAAGKRPVIYAAILYPGPSMTYGPGLAAICARPGLGLREALKSAISGALSAEEAEASS